MPRRAMRGFRVGVHVAAHRRAVSTRRPRDSLSRRTVRLGKLAGPGVRLPARVRAQAHTENGAPAFRVVRFDDPAVAFDKGQADPKTQTIALAAGREQRKEQAITYVRSNPAAGVLDLRNRADGSPFLEPGARAQGQATALRHLLERVGHQVD